jgi:hypothetical protein
MRLWAAYSEYQEVAIAGDREGLHALAAAVAGEQPHDVALDEPPQSWLGCDSALALIRIASGEAGDPRISFVRDGSALVMSGDGDALAGIVGGAISSLADEPPTKNSVASHVHLDPTSDPEKRYYAPTSISLVVEHAAPE